jgi:ppGpp synthetase/RelA/SpoT-type nucleotidyltranferase
MIANGRAGKRLPAGAVGSEFSIVSPDLPDLHKEPESDSEFGYVGEHFILKTPDDVIDEGAEDFVPEFFELQLKTLFQHAWSEAHHDLGYKSPRALSSLEKGKIAFTAAQAWGADRIFDELAWAVFENASPPAIDGVSPRATARSSSER